MIEELNHIRWMLAEIDSWQYSGLSLYSREHLRQIYGIRQKELEVKLELRLPTFTPEEADAAWPEYFQRKVLLDNITAWVKEGSVKIDTSQKMTAQAVRQLQDLEQQLEGHQPPIYPQTDSDRLDLVNFLLQAVDYLSQNDCFVSTDAEAQIRSPLAREQEELETKLGLRPTFVEEEIIEAETIAESTEEPQDAPLISKPVPEQVPISKPSISLGERLWQTLLSERTLQAVLFLGIFLIFTGAISGVFWGWQRFPPLVRVAIPTIFTVGFFTFGWYVRAKTPLYRSGLAISAIAALLIPIDFYTAYANFNISPEFGPSFWLVTSLFCLAAYVIATLIIRSRLFGYLVGIAAGSTMLALIQIGHQTFNLSEDWRSTGLAMVALCLLILAITFNYIAKKKLHFFTESFRYLSLIAIAVILPLTFGWRFLDRNTYDTLHHALVINWWIGGLMFGWAAIYFRSRGLGVITAIVIPIAVYLTQADIFYQLGINPTWHAIGLALLVSLYFVAGYRLSSADDAVACSHGRTAINGGIVLLILAVQWPLINLTSMAAIATTHTILAFSLILASLLWRRPGYLYLASLLSLSAITFGMNYAGLRWSQMGVGWASLSIIHLVVAIMLGSRFPIPLPNYARPLVITGYVIAALALIPPLFPYEGFLLAYVLGNWIGLSAWGAYLAHQNYPGFIIRSQPGKTIFHWFTAISLPIWLWIILDNVGLANRGLALSLAILAWLMVFLSYRFYKVDKAYRLSWWLTGILISIIAPMLTLNLSPSSSLIPAITVLAAGALYFSDAIIRRASWELFPAGLVTAGGCVLLLNRLHLPFDAVTFYLTLLVAGYILVGLWIERKRLAVFTHKFLSPLYLSAHVLSLFILLSVYRHVFNYFLGYEWTDEARLWGAAVQLVLSLVYGLYAWGTYRERWGHAAAWLGAASGGLIAITFSTGQGSSAAKGALMAIAFVLAERGLHWLRQHPQVKRRKQAIIRLMWHLYKRPLLVTGWAISVMIIGLALIRNLVLLGGRVQQIWAVIGLLLITGLYALSARLFKQARFMWFAAILIFAPWTILTHLGWFTGYYPSLPGFAISWAFLAWALFGCALLLSRFTPPAYILPLKTVCHMLLPFSLLWGIVDVDTSRITFGLAIGLYSIAALLDHQQRNESKLPLTRTKYFYPALGLIPIWSVYLMAWFLPTARPEHYGLMLLIFGPLGLVMGQWLKRVAPSTLVFHYALPAYLTSFATIMIGTMLVAHDPALRTVALLFDAILMLVYAGIFKHPIWAYIAAIIVPFALLSALGEAGVAPNRYGWWLIGLGALYLALTWALRRVKLPTYSAATLTVGFVLIALGLPPSSQDQIGAFWGYGSAALLYAIVAFWLGQPVLLFAASVLVVVPYATGLQLSNINSDYYGLALLPGAIVALALGRWLDHGFGKWQNFPWGNVNNWPMSITKRLLGWWGLALYVLGFGLAVASPFFTPQAYASTLNFALLMPIFGWAIYYFRLRVWLFTLVVSGHLAVIAFFHGQGWWYDPASVWPKFLPVTLITTLVASFIEQYFKEGSPLSVERVFYGWSRPLYIVLLFDMVVGQLFSLQGNWSGFTVSLTHTLLIAIFASIWLSSQTIYGALVLGTFALIQLGTTFNIPIEDSIVLLSQLILIYGLVGYSLTFVRNKLSKNRELQPWLTIWESPLQHFSIILSVGVLVLTIWLGIDVVSWTIAALVGLPFRNMVAVKTIHLVVNVLAFLGLLYLATAFMHRRLRLGYMATAMLLISWSLHIFYIQQWDNVQWYAIPVGLYLLTLSYFEWNRGNKVLARWLDYLALSLMIGSLFWQTLLFGLNYYAFILGLEGLVTGWYGSARRLRRFLYGGVVGAILAVVGWLINSWWSVNQWIVFGIVGLLLVILAIAIERNLESIKVWQELDTWE